MSENSLPFSILPSQSSSKSNRLTFSQTTTRPRVNSVSSLNKSPQKTGKNNINNNFSSHRKMLYSPNGRSPYSSGNGIGYNTYPTAKSGTGINGSSHTSNNDQTTSSQSTSYDKECGYVDKNIDAATLNNIFFSLSQNIESIYNMVRSICLPHNNNVETFSQSHSLPLNNDNVQQQ